MAEEPDIYNTLFEDGSDLPLVVTSSITRSYQWAVACGADLSYLNGYYLNDLPTGLYWRAAAQELAEDWGIEGKQDFRSIASSLENTEYSLELAGISGTLKRGRGQSAENMRAALDLFRQEGLSPKNAIPKMQVWDLARLIVITRLAFDAKMLTREEAFGKLAFCAVSLQNIYGSWRELSVGYQFAHCVLTGVDEENYAAARETMNLLLTTPESPWVTFKFNVKLSFDF